MPARFTRRAFSKIAALAVAGSPAISSAQVARTNASQAVKSGTGPGFPEGFRWGTATSAYQVEGAVKADGRAASIWDTFCAQPGKIRDGSSGDPSVDHYHRFPEDIALMKAMGAGTYRFSIAWPRVFPDGTGTPNPKGLDFYDRLVDALLAAGIQPYATLYHWDLPQALQDRWGGWQSRDTAEAFGACAGHVARKLGDRVRSFFTTNELMAFVEHGHASGIFAPGLQLPPAGVAQVRHHAVLGHGLAAQAVRANAPHSVRGPLRVGPAENIVTAVPAIESEAHIAAAERATREMNAGYLTVMMEGRYTDAFLARAGANAPKFTDADLKIISTPVDFVGLNVYVPGAYVMAADTPAGYAIVPMSESHPRMASTWLMIGPEAIYWAPRHAAKLWNVKDLYITENGASAADVPAADGTVYDIDRVMYLRNYLTQLQRATAQGIPVRGYFLWSLLDNFEWADGYATRFGLVHVDYATQKRTPKLSAAFFKEVIARNAVA